MTAFQRIYETERLAAEVARDAPRRRRLAAQAIHAAAAQELDRFWHELSIAMCAPPRPHWDEGQAAYADCGDEALNAAVEALRRITGRSGRRN